MQVGARERFEVARATAADRRFVERLAEEAFAEFDPRALENVRAMLTAPRSATWVATVDGRPAGFVVLELSGQRALVQAIAVRHEQRGRGLGQRLLSTAESFAWRSGARSLSLATAQENVGALALFLKSGFVIVRRMKRFYGRGQDACSLVKPFPA